MMRPKSVNPDMPPRLQPVTRTLKSGKVWTSYYYNGRDENGNRKMIPLGKDLDAAKRKWAELECKPVPAEAGTMRVVFDRHEREIVPTKAPRTQTNNRLELKPLRAIFDSAPIDAITPQHIAQYRDNRWTKTRTLKDGTEIPARRATVAANRELALFSTVWNHAREWVFTAKANPCEGVKKHKETPRDFYADSAVWDAVRDAGGDDLRDAMDLAYLTAQRVADVLKMTQRDIENDALGVRQGKTSKRLGIMLTDPETGARTELGQLLDRITARPVRSLWLLATPTGRRMSSGMLRLRFVAARTKAAEDAEQRGEQELAGKIRRFQFRDARPKAASEMKLEDAQRLLGHSKEQMTKAVYRRIGEKVRPTK